MPVSVWIPAPTFEWTSPAIPAKQSPCPKKPRKKRRQRRKRRDPTLSPQIRAVLIDRLEDATANGRIALQANIADDVPFLDMTPAELVFLCQLLLPDEPLADLKEMLARKLKKGRERG